MWFLMMIQCMTGPAIFICEPSPCNKYDLFEDGHLDLRDYAEVQNEYWERWND